MEALFAGIDWSWQHHAVYVVDDAGRRVQEVIVISARQVTSLRALWLGWEQGRQVRRVRSRRRAARRRRAVAPGAA